MIIKTKEKEMSKGNNKTKKGFTIIEVVLVLAIAGLIFLMVFIALPALQRAQRNTQREDDLARFLTAVTDYQSNNSGNTPFGSNKDSKGATLSGNFVTRYIDSSCAQVNIGTEATCDSEGSAQFRDPDGTVYMFRPAQFDQNPGSGDIEVRNLPTTTDHTIYVAVGHVCGTNEGTLAQGTGPRQIALTMVLEGGAVTCNDNQ